MNLWENNEEIKYFQEYLRIPSVQPDVDYNEEMGGTNGMKPFVISEDFKSLNVGFSMDEGIASPTEIYPVFYGERSTWEINFHISGTTGHGSLLHKNTAGEKLRYLLDKFMDFRAHEVKRLENNPNWSVGDVTTVNLTQVSGGVQSNVVPPEMVACFDIRISLDLDHAEFEKQMIQWCKEAGGGIEFEFLHKEPLVLPTKTDDTNPFWVAFKSVVDELGLKIKTLVFPAGTDSRFIRRVGIPAIGFSPMNHTPVLLHDHDEFLKADTYLEGVEIYKKLIPKIANV